MQVQRALVAIMASLLCSSVLAGAHDGAPPMAGHEVRIAYMRAQLINQLHQVTGNGRKVCLHAFPMYTE